MGMILAWFLNYGTAIVAVICATISAIAGLLCLKRFTKRRLSISLLGLLAAGVFLIGNFPFNMWLFENANNRAFGVMSANLKQEPIDGKTKAIIAAKYGKPSPFSRSQSGNLETWSYSPGPFLSYGGMDAICIEFKDNVVNRWYISWF